MEVLRDIWKSSYSNSKKKTKNHRIYNRIPVGKKGEKKKKKDNTIQVE